MQPRPESLPEAAIIVPLQCSMPGMEPAAPEKDIAAHRVAHAAANDWKLASISSTSSNVVLRAMLTM